jgi:hypothetical protein
MKNMKTKSISIAIVLVVLTIQSCNNYLKETLVSDVSANQYYSTAAGLEDAVDATYQFMKYVYSNERAYSLTVFGTDTYTNGADGGFKGFNFYDATLRSDQSILQEMWQWCYRGINQANAVIDRSAGLKDVPATTITQRNAEVRFLRALYYFTLVRQWGSIPLPLTETIEAVTTAPKATEAQVYDVIVADLKFAIATLPNSQSDYGRATKPAAEHLLGLVLLTRGYTTYAKPNDFDSAIINFTSVITNYGFSLAPSMTALWDQDNQRNKEIIFAVQNSTNVLYNSGGDGVAPGEGNRGHLFFLQQYDIQPGMIRDIANGRPFKRFRPTAYLLNLWEADRTKDARYDQTYKHVWYANNAPPNANNYPQWTAGDVLNGAVNKDGSSAVAGQYKFALGDTALYIPGPGNEAKWIANNYDKVKKVRYKVFLRTPYAIDQKTGVLTLSTSTANNYDDFNFAHIAKFMDPRRPTIQWTEGSRDWFIMRLGDTYLLRAEAYFNKGNTTSAATDINTVRTRAAKPGQVAAMQIAPSQVTMDFILDERAKELDAEQCRWYDLVRTGTLVSRVKLYNLLGAGNIQTYHVRRPYPQTQIDRTTPVGSFIQNCGYPGGPACN